MRLCGRAGAGRRLTGGLALARPSKHEEQVLAWIKQYADARGLEWTEDAVRNLVVRRPGTGGGEGAPAVVIQGHVDVVTEKNSDTVHDFFTDPLKLRTDGPWLKATGTTLGSDNGIGVATALALLDLPATQKLPPLECLFTVDEETGLTGAFELDGSMLTGRTMLNLDTEEWGALYVGCAGGGDSTVTLARDLEPAPAGLEALELRLTGLMGGHSGTCAAPARGKGGTDRQTKPKG